MTTASTALAAFDGRPFFDKALRYGVRQGILTPERLQLIGVDFSKGIVQIASYFGTAHLRPELELALHRMVNLLSLYLEDLSGGDLRIAANSLRDKTFLSHSKAGSEMLKRLHAMPDSTVIGGAAVSPENQRAYLDEKTSAATIPLAEYRAELASRQENQRTIDFALWLAKRLGASRDEIAGIDDAEALIRSGMLLVFVRQAEWQLPTRTAFVGLIDAARRAGAKRDDERLSGLVIDAPPDFQDLARRAMDRFVATTLPQIRAPGSSADKLLYGEAAQAFFIRESVDEDVRAYERLVAREWERVTHGESDDPAVLATVFLFIATGLAPKPSMLLKEAKEVIRRFRNDGFDTPAVIAFVTAQAPEAAREDLKRFWQDDLKGDAETQLADSDPNWPDSHMERALAYLRKTCCATWKGPRR